MKRLIVNCLLALFVLAGCSGEDSARIESLDKVEAAPMEEAPVIELTAEEEALIETLEETAEETEAVTRENYEEALKELEDALNSEQ